MLAIIKRAALLTAAILVIGVGSASARPHGFGGGHVVVGVGRGHVFGPFYDPFWGPYPYPYGAYGVYPYLVHPEGAVRVEVTPKQAQV